MSFLAAHGREILDREKDNTASVHLTGRSYWVAFERSACQMCRLFPQSETAVFRFREFPFPVVMASVEDDSCANTPGAYPPLPGTRIHNPRRSGALIRRIPTLVPEKGRGIQTVNLSKCTIIGHGYIIFGDRGDFVAVFVGVVVRMVRPSVDGSYRGAEGHRGRAVEPEASAASCSNFGRSLRISGCGCRSRQYEVVFGDGSELFVVVMANDRDDVYTGTMDDILGSRQGFVS